jgi:hypothetical protein
MSANYNLAPFNNIVPHCPFCGLSPMGSPCEHLKAILELEEPYEGGTEIKFLSDDFRQLLKDTVKVEFEFEFDLDAPGPPKRWVDREYYIVSNEGLDSPNDLVDFANAMDGSVCFQQHMGGANGSASAFSYTRSITFAIDEKQVSEKEAFANTIKSFNSEAISTGAFTSKLIDGSDGSQCLDLEESLKLEFKQTFTMDVRTGQKSKEIKETLVKELVGFMNTNGGCLLIGVEDKEKNIVGIEPDGFKGDFDKYSRQITDFIKERCGVTAASLLDIDYFNSNEKTVCVVTCKKSSEPIFCKLRGARDGVPLVRYGSSTTQPSYQEWEKWKTEYFVEDLSTI